MRTGRSPCHRAGSALEPSDLLGGAVMRTSQGELNGRFNSAGANILNATNEIRAFSLLPPASPEKSPQRSQTAGGEATNDMEPCCLLVLRHGQTFCFDCRGFHLGDERSRRSRSRASSFHHDPRLEIQCGVEAQELMRYPRMTVRTATSCCP